LVDASALIAIIAGEPEASALADRLAAPADTEIGGIRRVRCFAAHQLLVKGSMKTETKNPLRHVITAKACLANQPTSAAISTILAMNVQSV
jgi:uncharacterized protein with PIN domain